MDLALEFERVDVLASRQAVNAHVLQVRHASVVGAAADHGDGRLVPVAEAPGPARGGGKELGHAGRALPDRRHLAQRLRLARRDGPGAVPRAAGAGAGVVRGVEDLQAGALAIGCAGAKDCLC